LAILAFILLIPLTFTHAHFLIFSDYHILFFQHTQAYIKSFHDLYRGADKPLARPTSRCILFDGWNISFDASLVIYK